MSKKKYIFINRKIPLLIYLEELMPYHLDQVIAIERASFFRPWNKYVFKNELFYSDSMGLVALLPTPSKLVVGYIIISLVINEAQIQNLAIHPVFRRLGIGRHLLEEGMNIAYYRGARYATLEVRVSNLIARNLYNSLGFKEVGCRLDYYQPEGEAALLLNYDFIKK